MAGYLRWIFSRRAVAFIRCCSFGRLCVHDRLPKQLYDILRRPCHERKGDELSALGPGLKCEELVAGLFQGGSRGANRRHANQFVNDPNLDL